MPLPRPFGDPFGRPSVKDNEKVIKKKREVAPISSSAFSFHLGTTPSNTNSSVVTSTNTPKKLEIKREPKAVDKKVQSTPAGYGTPLREVSRSSLTPGPSKGQGRPLQSLPSPFGGSAFRTPNPTTKLEHGTRLNDMDLFGGVRSGNVKGKRKASEYDTGINEAKVGMGMGLDSPVPGKREMKALGQLDKFDLGESVYLEDIQKRVEEEGIGVSPRGKKIIKYSGKGPPPPSFVLSNALSSQHSSLVLFYVSLQSTLFPTRTPRKSRMTPSAFTEGALQPTSIPKGPSALQHLRTAPLVVHVTRVVEGRTGWSVMVRGYVVRGQVEGTELGPNTKRNEISEVKNPDDSGPMDPDDGSVLENKTSHGVVITTEPASGREVVLVLQPVPPECPKLGLDARMITLRPPSSSIAYEIGIWPAWSDTTFDSHLSTHDFETYRGDKHDEQEREGEKGEGQQQKVVFANRYLIAERDDTLL